VPTGAVIELDEQAFGNTDIKAPAHFGNSYFSRGSDLTHPRFASAYFYDPESYAGKPAEVDSLLRQVVARY
jgi:hypothetical protein